MYSSNSLNERQRQAVYHDSGGVLVLAGAGTGKTRVLTERIVRLLADNLATPRDILAVTFTNKAAREMRTRVEAAITPPPMGLMLGTFHSICHRILRIHADAANLDRNFQILDTQDQLIFLRRLFRENGVDEKSTPPAEVRAYITAQKEHGIRAQNAVSHNPRTKKFIALYALYESTCRREHKLDFAELMLATLELWQNHEEIRRHYAQRFRHILVDEMQDTNQQQFNWLQMLDNGDNHFFAVGDDDQSIYGFRGAQPNVMRDFQSTFRADALVRLEENYRSSKNILAAANQLITGNQNRLGKTLTATIDDNEKIAVHITANDIAEAESVADAISMQLNNGVFADDIAVLYRVNAQSRLIERALMKRGIHYRVYGGLRFYDRTEIKHALAYLRLIAADDRDALLRVINVPTRGIGDKTVATLFADNIPFAALQNPINAKVGEFWTLIKTLRNDKELSLGQLTRAVIEKSGLLEHYESRKELERADNLRELVNATTQFAAMLDNENTHDDALTTFLASTALAGDLDNPDGGGAINLMTVHAAKGLEFHQVFIVGLEEGLFPHARSLESNNKQDLEEERRLLYVAITRAKRRLSMHFAHQRMLYGAPSNNPSSRFLNELPSDCLSLFSPFNQQPPKPRIPTLVETPNRRSFATSPLAISDKLRPGDWVQHAKYGKGVVVRCGGARDNAEADVTFKKFGLKSFKLSLAKLEKIS